MNRLLEIGFKPVGHWILANGEIAPDLKEMPTQRNILYAFVCEGEIQFIGKATQQLSITLLSYQRPNQVQSAKLRNSNNIRELLSLGKKVDILALPDNGLLHYGGFRINLAAGLEDSMIAKLQPHWNVLRSSRFRPGEAGKPEPSEDIANEAKPEIQDRTENVPLHAVPETMLLTLQETYWNRGFFNVPVQYAPHFGGDLQKISIIVPHRQLPITGYISRAANSNGTPRVMGGRELQKWFRRESRPMGKINVEILSPTSIVLTPIAEKQ
jgi:hypothetical protein